MKIDRKLLNRKVFNFILGLLCNFALLAAASRLRTAYESSAMLFSSGLLAYALLADFGFGKPLYARIREFHILDDTNGISGVFALSQFYIVTACVVLWIALTGAMLWHAHTWKGGSWQLASVLAFSLMCMCGVALFRDLHEAFDNNLWYERIDGTRRGAILVCSIAAALTHRLWWYAVPMAVLSFALLAVCWIRYEGHRSRTAVRVSIFSLSMLRAESKLVRSAASNNLLFRLGEIVLYNWGMIAYAGGTGLRALVVFATWQRVFIGLSTPNRVVQDSTVPSFTAAWFKQEHKNNLRGLLMKCTYITLAVSVVFVVIGKPMITYLTKSAPVHVWWLISACVLWSFANILQHLAGTYLLAINEQLKQLSWTTIWFTMGGALVLFVLTKVTGLVQFENVEVILNIFGVLYAVYAVAQVRLLVRILRAHRGEA